MCNKWRWSLWRTRLARTTAQEQKINDGSCLLLSLVEKFCLCCLFLTECYCELYSISKQPSRHSVTSLTYASAVMYCGQKTHICMARFHVYMFFVVICWHALYIVVSFCISFCFRCLRQLFNTFHVTFMIYLKHRLGQSDNCVILFCTGLII